MSKVVEGDWYCPNCGYLSSSRVTFNERCDECHAPVEVRDVGTQSLVGQQTKRIAELEAEVARLERKLATRGELIESLQVRNAELEAEVKTAWEEVHESHKTIGLFSQDVEQLEAEVKRLEKVIWPNGS